eukprot:gene5520-3981_t
MHMKSSLLEKFAKMSASFSNLIKRASGHTVRESFRETLSKTVPTTVSTLNNGVRVACESIPTSRIATVGLWLDAGARYEDPYYAGTSQMLQKCGFLGTANQSTKEIAAAVDELGGSIYVYVGREYSCVYMSVMKDNVEKAVGLLADISRNARLTEADITEGRKLVAHDMAARDQCLEKTVLNNLYHASFGSSNCGLGTPYQGIQGNLQRVGIPQLQEFRNLKSGPMTEKISPSVFHGAESRIKVSDGPTGASWAFECCGASSSDTISLTLACTLCAQSLQGGVAQKPFLHTFKDVGICGTMIAELPGSTNLSRSKHVADTFQRSVSRWRGICQGAVDPQRLEQAKAQLKNNILLSMDGGNRSVMDIGKQILQIGRRVPIGEMFDRIDQVSSSQLQKIAQHYFLGKELAFSYVGTTEHFPTYARAKRWSNRVELLFEYIMSLR